jgi:hypothetical protein
MSLNAYSHMFGNFSIQFRDLIGQCHLNRPVCLFIPLWYRYMQSPYFYRSDAHILPLSCIYSTHETFWMQYAILHPEICL